MLYCCMKRKYHLKKVATVHFEPKYYINICEWNVCKILCEVYSETIWKWLKIGTALFLSTRHPCWTVELKWFWYYSPRYHIWLSVNSTTTWTWHPGIGGYFDQFRRSRDRSTWLTIIGGLAVVAFWRSPHGLLGSGPPRAG